jgi:hypothetical protein
VARRAALTAATSSMTPAKVSSSQAGTLMTWPP